VHRPPYNLTGIKLPGIFQMSVELDQQILDEHLLDLFASQKLLFLGEHLLDGIFESLRFPKSSLCIRIVHEFISPEFWFPMGKTEDDGLKIYRII
jgi:hypothetical protein